MDADISGNGDVFDGERAIGRAHVRVPRVATSTERRSGPSDRRMGAIWISDYPPNAVPDLEGKELTMRLDDGRIVHFLLLEKGDIHVFRVT